MPDFGNPFSGLKNDRSLTKEELIRAIRFFIAAEYEATQLYTQLADSIDDADSIKVLRDIAEEEIVHAGEFLRLLVHLRPEEFKSYLEGIKETEEMIKKAEYITKGNVLYWKTPTGKTIPVGIFAPNESGFLKTVMPKKRKSLADVLRSVASDTDPYYKKLEKEYNELTEKYDKTIIDLNTTAITLERVAKNISEHKNSSPALKTEAKKYAEKTKELAAVIRKYLPKLA